MKTNQEIAKEVWEGKWGNNADRKRRLTEAGYSYEAIMSIVNSMANPMEVKPVKETGNNGFEIIGDKTLAVSVDLNQYNSIKLFFTFGEENG